MIFGPFSLADASDARAEFRVWSETELPFDHFIVAASRTGTNFGGFQLLINTNWRFTELDLTNVPGLGDLTGDSSVWFAFLFISDFSINNFEGSYVDNILIEKLVGVPCYLLSLSHTGSGSDPVASPGGSSGCSFGQYHAGANISLTAIASSGWEVGSWTGTSDDSSTSTSNSLVMPASSHSASVNYIPCVGIPNDLVLADDTLMTPAFYEACDSITLGPNLFITAGGTGVIVRAPFITFVGRVEGLTGGVATFGGQ